MNYAGAGRLLPLCLLKATKCLRRCSKRKLRRGCSGGACG